MGCPVSSDVLWITDVETWYGAGKYVYLYTGTMSCWLCWQAECRFDILLDIDRGTRNAHSIHWMIGTEIRHSSWCVARCSCCWHQLVNFGPTRGSISVTIDLAIAHNAMDSGYPYAIFWKLILIFARLETICGQLGPILQELEKFLDRGSYFSQPYDSRIRDED